MVIAPRLAEHPDVLAAGARLPGRLHDHALRRAGRRCSPTTTVRALRRRLPRSRTRCSTSRSRRRRGRSRCPTTTSSCAAQQIAALEAALDVLRRARARVRAPLGPRLRRARGVPARRRRARARRARLDGRHDQGRRRRAARRGRARRAAEDLLVPAVPGGARRRRCSPDVADGDRARPRGLARRRAAALRRGRRRAAAAPAPSCDGHVYGLGGRDLHPRGRPRRLRRRAPAPTSACRGEPCPV